MNTQENSSFRDQCIFIKNEIQMDEECIYLEVQLQKQKKELTQLELQSLGKIGDIKAVQEKITAIVKKETDINESANSLHQRKRSLTKKLKRVNPQTVI